MFDMNAASKKVSYHWRRLGAVYETKAKQHAEQGYFDSAMKAARMAEACYWQATGEHDFIGTRDVLPTPNAEGK